MVKKLGIARLYAFSLDLTSDYNWDRSTNSIDLFFVMETNKADDFVQSICRLL